MKTIDSSSARALRLLCALHLLALPALAQIAPTVSGSLGGLAPETVVDRVADFRLSPPQQAAVGFTMGPSAQTFESLRLPVWNNTGSGATLDGGIFSDNGGNPGTLLAAFAPVTPDNTPMVRSMSLASGTFVLSSGVSYWFVVHDVGLFAWSQITGSTTVVASDGAVFLGWNASFDNGSTWSGASSGGLIDPIFGASAPQFDIYTTAATVPEPPAVALLLGLAVLWRAAGRGRRG